MEQIILFAFLSLYPFGQIIKIGIINPIDIIVGLGALYALIRKYKRPKVFKYFENFLFLAVSSWIFAFFLFQTSQVFYGFLYLVRLAAYFYFFLFVSNFVKKSKELLLDSLLLISVASAVFGWIQYFLFPSIRAFLEYGWDEHLFRLVGTFLDPTFLGLIIVFGLITTMFRMMVVRRKGMYLLICIFLLVSLAFTYSRASYLAFFAGLLIILTHFKKIKYFIGAAGLLLIVILLLPTSKNHVLSFTRNFSAIARIENYQETLKIFKTSPVFGIGFNNMCLARNKYIGVEPFSSHACSGSDSSLLLILATTGISGFFVFIQLIFNIWKRSDPILKSSLIALFVHSLFSNSIFYPWIMGWLIILFSVRLRRESEG